MRGLRSARKLALLLVVAVAGAGLGVVLLGRSARIQLGAQVRVLPSGDAAEAPATEAAGGPTVAQQRAGLLLGVLAALDRGTTPDFAVSIVDHKGGATFSYDVTIAVMSHGNPNLDGGIALVEEIAQATRTELEY